MAQYAMVMTQLTESSFPQYQQTGPHTTVEIEALRSSLVAKNLYHRVLVVTFSVSDEPEGIILDTDEAKNREL